MSSQPNSRPSSPWASKRILITYTRPSKSKLLPSQSETSRTKKVIVIEKMKQTASFESVGSNLGLPCSSGRLIQGKLSPGSKKEVFVAQKRPPPDQENAGLNYVCFSNNIL